MRLWLMRLMAENTHTLTLSLIEIFKYPRTASCVLEMFQANDLEGRTDEEVAEEVLVKLQKEEK